MYDNIFIIKNMVATHFNFDFYKKTIGNIGASEWGYWTPNFEDGAHVVWISYHKKEAASTHICETTNQFTRFHAEKVEYYLLFSFTKTCSLKNRNKNSVEIFFLGFFKQFKTRPDNWFGVQGTFIRVCPRGGGILEISPPPSPLPSC